MSAVNKSRTSLRLIAAAGLLLFNASVVRVQAQFDYIVTNGTVTITRYTGPDGPVTVPGTINGFPVIEIGDHAFSGRTNLTAVIIPDSVASIGDYAFMSCRRMTSVAMGAGLAHIGEMAFYDCSNLASIVIPNGVTSIGRGAFSSCGKLTSIIIPNAVTNIDSGPFCYCRNLTEIRVDPLNPSYTSEDGILFDKTRTALLQFPGLRAGAYMPPDAVTAIAPLAFAGCNLSSVTVHSNIASIGDFAFNQCASLSNVSYAGGVITIGARAFQNCALASVNIPDTVDTLGYGVFLGCTNLASATLGAGITDIPLAAFASCASLTSITIPYGVTNIGGPSFDWQWGGGAFSGCTSLTNVALPGSVITIGGAAFLRCTNLATITIPNSVTSICSGAFAECRSLDTADIGSGVVSIAYDAFVGCGALNAMNVNPANPAYSSLEGVLFNKSQTMLLKCPEGKIGAFSIPGTVTNVAAYAFANCARLTDVAIPGSVLALGQGAFSRCTRLTRIAVPNSVNRIPDGVFSGCSNLTNAVLGKNVVSMGYGVFENCGKLAGVYFLGNAPSSSEGVLYGTLTTVYYLPGTTGWHTTFGGRPTALWLPRIESSDTVFGIHNNKFCFNIGWADDRVVEVHACTNLANPDWTVLQTLTITNGTAHFSDPDWASHSRRFYRVHPE